MKNEYSLLNDVKVDFSEYKIEEVNELEKKRMMKNFVASKNKKVFLGKKKILAAVVALFLVVNLGVYSDKITAAAASLKYSISNWLGINSSIDSREGEFQAKIGKTFEANGTKLVLNEFFTDNSRIIINLNINKGINDTVKNHLKLVPDFYVNGKKVERASNYVGYSVQQFDEKVEESNLTLEVEGKDLTLSNRENVKVVFSALAKECNVSASEFTYSFVYDSTRYKNASTMIKVDKDIVVGENKLSVGNVTVTPDRVLISGSSKGFSAWDNNKSVNYYYDIVDENGDSVPLKEEIGKGSYFYRFCVPDDVKKSRDASVAINTKAISTLKIIPYTFNKINTNTTVTLKDGRTKYILEDKIITVNLKNEVDTNKLISH